MPSNNVSKSNDLRYCGCGGKTFVVDSRASNRSGALMRRRECRRCGERFTTYEVIEETLSMVDEAVAKRIRVDRLSHAIITALNL